MIVVEARSKGAENLHAQMCLVEGMIACGCRYARWSYAPELLDCHKARVLWSEADRSPQSPDRASQRIRTRPRLLLAAVFLPKRSRCLASRRISSSWRQVAPVSPVVIATLPS